MKQLLVVWALLIVCLLPAVSEAGKQVRLRINTSHGLENARGAVEDAGLRLTTDVAVTPSSADDGQKYLRPDSFIKDALADGATIISSSFSGWDSSFDPLWYVKLTGNSLVHVFAYEPRNPQPRNIPPPAAFVTVNRIGGKTGDGIEFGVPENYMHGKGQSNYPSGVTAQLAGLMACIAYLRPDWNWFDVKAALRGTAANFGSGYDPLSYGYGAVDYRAAVAIGDAATLPLFAPAVYVRKVQGDRLDFVVNAFRQSRRSGDALFMFGQRPAVTGKELTLADINALGGVAVFSGELPGYANRYSYRAARGGSVYFVWFTRDVRGYYSRIEPFSIIGPVRFGGRP